MPWSWQELWGWDGAGNEKTASEQVVMVMLSTNLML